MSAGRDDLLERLLADARCDAAAGESAEAYERRGTSIEIVEDAEGSRLSVVTERGFALRLFRSGRTAFAASSFRRRSRSLAEMTSYGGHSTVDRSGTRAAS